MLKKLLLGATLGLLMMGCTVTGTSSVPAVEVDVDEPEPMAVMYDARPACCEVYLNGSWIYDLSRWNAHRRHHEWRRRKEHHQQEQRRTPVQQQTPRQHTPPPPPAPAVVIPAPVTPKPVQTQPGRVRKPKATCWVPGTPNPQRLPQCR